MWKSHAYMLIGLDWYLCRRGGQKEGVASDLDTRAAIVLGGGSNIQRRGRVGQRGQRPSQSVRGAQVRTAGRILPWIDSFEHFIRVARLTLLIWRIGTCSADFLHILFIPARNVSRCNYKCGMKLVSSIMSPRCLYASNSLRVPFDSRWQYTFNCDESLWVIAQLWDRAHNNK